VSVVGDAVGVWLLSGNGQQVVAAGQHPPGAYQILAQWGDEQLPAGKITLKNGTPVTLDCSSFLFTCRAK
jgi:hypothetical protein